MEVLYQEMYKMKRVEARKRLVTTYRETKSIRKTAKLWGTSRLVIRKWLRRYKEKGEKGLQDVSRRPRRSPRRTSLPMEAKVLKMRKEKGYGRRRIAWMMSRKPWKKQLREVATLLAHPIQSIPAANQKII